MSNNKQIAYQIAFFGQANSINLKRNIINLNFTFCTLMICVSFTSSQMHSNHYWPQRLKQSWMFQSLKRLYPKRALKYPAPTPLLAAKCPLFFFSPLATYLPLHRSKHIHWQVQTGQDPTSHMSSVEQLGWTRSACLWSGSIFS